MSNKYAGWEHDKERLFWMKKRAVELADELKHFANDNFIRESYDFQEKLGEALEILKILGKKVDRDSNL